MKKLLSLTLALLLCVSLAACKSGDKETDGEQNDNGVVENNNSSVYEDVNLTALADSLYAEIPEDQRPMLMSMPLTDEDFEYFAFIPYEEGLEAVVSEPMIGSIAHSVVIVKAKDAVKASEVAEAMKANANPKKWVCVEADVVEAVTNKNLAMLLMTKSDGGMKDAILNAFANINDQTIANLEQDTVLDVEEDFTEGEVEIDDSLIDVPEVLLPDDSVAVDSTVDNEPSVGDEGINVPAVMPEVLPEENEEQVHLPSQPVADAGSIDELYNMADKLYEGISPENMPMVGTMELTEENFEYSAFVPYKDTYLAVESLPMMGSQPHSVVIVKTESEAEAALLAQQMKDNANPRKWICVAAKAVKSAAKGNFAMLVMTSVDVMPSDTIDEETAEAESYKLSEERADIIINNFLAA